MTGPVQHHWERWGHLAKRYQTEQPRKILALDGGGIRGIITLGVLKQLERQLGEAQGTGDEFRLCDYFDLIGGTSTGAIIAAALATGLSVTEIDAFYRDFGTIAFARRKIWERLQSLYAQGGLTKTLQEKFGADTDLHPENLRCLLVVVTRNATTDSAWPISSNPDAKYNDPDRDNCNLKIPLWRIVRASTAAPVYFPPEVISWDDKDPTQAFVFVDGGTTAYNNPAFLLFKMATEPAYNLGWPTGEQNLLVVSVGTGAAPVLGDTADDPATHVLAATMNTLSSLMSQASVDQDVSCRVVGRCTYGGVIDRELHDLVPADPAIPDDPLPLDRDLGKLFLYVRYNAELTPEGLKQLELEDLDARRMRKMDDVDNAAGLTRIGEALGQKVKLAHLGNFAPGQATEA
jgi:predicted acylesterase/phospholipase RssA